MPRCATPDASGRSAPFVATSPGLFCQSIAPNSFSHVIKSNRYFFANLHLLSFGRDFTRRSGMSLFASRLLL
jgi:hypothetical protein